MPHTNLRHTRPANIAKVHIDDSFWAPRLEANRKVTLPHQYNQLKEEGAIDVWSGKPGQPTSIAFLWDSDVGKWSEAVAYSLATHPNQRLESWVDDVINRMEEAQLDDGYLNSRVFFEPENRFTSLRSHHELYCAGHLMEAAVAYYETTGKQKFLDILCRYADHIDTLFGPKRGQRRGYPGHEEIELALVKLYRATGEKRYLKLAKYFIDERGRQPHYFDQESHILGEHPAGPYDYFQAHLPVREQTTAEGHAVRAVYLFSGMADVAAETGDKTLLTACKRLWKNMTQRRLYITGGIGSTIHGERFTFDYDLPNETAYCETCASIGLVFFAHRMLQVDPDGNYGDVMEQALYNNVLSGVGLDGKSFFYCNPLTVSSVLAYPRRDWNGKKPDHVRRLPWFNCACCPPNLARLLASLGKYVYTHNDREVYVHLYVGGTAELDLAARTVKLIQKTEYPWKGKIRIRIQPETPATFTLALRIPGWCRNPGLKVNGQGVKLEEVTRRGYARIRREWSNGDHLELSLPMPVERVVSHPRVRMNAGRVALQRGPIVYAFEEIDNGKDLHNIVLPRAARLRARFDKKLLGGVTVITGRAKRRVAADSGSALYRAADPGYKSTTIKAVPYCVWCNRRPGEMVVWIREE